MTYSKEQGMLAIQKNIENAVAHQNFIEQGQPAKTLISEIGRTQEFKPVSLPEIDNINAQYAFKKSSVPTEHFAAAMKQDINHAVDKIASQLKNQEKESMRNFTDVMDIHHHTGDKLKDKLKSSFNKDQITPSENRKMPEKQKEIDREIDF